MRYSYVGYSYVKRGWLLLVHISVAERSYPTSEVRGSGREELPKSEVGAKAKRSYTASEVRGGGWEELPHAPMPETRGGGQEELPHTRGQGWWPGRATPCPRPGAADWRTNPTSKEQWLHGHRRA